MTTNKTLAVNLTKEDIEFIHTALHAFHRDLDRRHDNSAVLHALKMLRDDFKTLRLANES